jgi:cation diffusion facilitator family transporter
VSGLTLPGKGASDGGSVDVDFGDDAVYAPYTPARRERLSMSRKERICNERRTLRYSLYGVLFFVVLALGFALLTDSGAILFDGIYSLIAFCMALLTLKVAKLAERPDDEQFHFGYTSLEPTLNLFKALIVIVSCVYAAVEAAQRLLAGGSPADYRLAVVYGVAATIGSLTVAWLMYRSSREYRSDLVRVEAKTWLIDGLFSCFVLGGFLVAWWLDNSAWPQYAPMVDPLILVGLVFAALPVPVKILLDSFREVISMAPPEAVVEEIEERLKDSLKHFATRQVELRVNKRGRNTYLLVHVVVPETFVLQSIADLDRVRRHSEAALKAWNPEIVMDMLFVQDPSLAE